MIKRIECSVSAERVGYNYLLWISKLAINLGIKGNACIRNDGSIGIIAEADDEVLASFIEKVKRGHPIFHMFVTIDNFFVKWHEPKNDYTDFSVTLKEA